MFPPLLFNKIDIFSILENQKAALRTAVASAPQSLSNSSDDDIVQSFVSQFGLTVPTLVRETREVTEKEIDFDVSYDQRRMFINRSHPYYIKGTQITIFVPFVGEAILFDVQPSSFSLSPPRDSVEKNELRLIYEFPNDSPPQNLKAQIDRDLQDIEQHLDRLRVSAEQLTQELRSIAAQAWLRRKSEFATRGQLIVDLGLPKRESDLANSPAIGSRIISSNTSRLSTSVRAKTNWQVFISHAYEDKEAIAKPLADALIKVGLSVWYDNYTLKVGDSLRQKIDEGLSCSKFGIVVLSKSFFAKHWPQQELNGLAAREANKRKVILPVWHDITKGEIAEESPILADRLGVSSSVGLDQVVKELLRAME